MREDQLRRSRRRRIIWQIGSIVGVIALVVAVFFGYQSWRDQQISASVGPRNMLSDGLLIAPGGSPVTTAALAPGASPVASQTDNSGTVANIQVYVDFLCPYCGEFEKANSDQIRQLVSRGSASLELHPVSILTNSSAGTKYSLRAANAFACVADVEPAAAWAFSEALFANQPAEGSPGLEDKQLKDIAQKAGVTQTSEVNSCIDKQTFKAWVMAATDRATNNKALLTSTGQFGTPRVMVNGKSYGGSLTSSDEFRAFVVQATAQSGVKPTASPTPTK